MCRLLGFLGSRLAPAAPWLVDSDRSLLAQSNVSTETAQRDGWGIAWYEGSRVPRVEKGIRGAFTPGEREQYEQAARAAHGPVVLGHLRDASNPLGLPHSRLIAMENSQPFTSGSSLFIHNGAINLPKETRPRLGKFESRVKGVNDSEVLFWLITRHLEEEGDPLRAYALAREDLTEVWKEANRRTREPYTGLNVIFTRGPNELWAFCHWLGEHGSGLIATDQPYYRMGYQSDAKSLLVGSEPFSAEHPSWRPLGDGEYLRAQVDHGLVGITTGRIP